MLTIRARFPPGSRVAGHGAADDVGAYDADALCALIRKQSDAPVIASLCLRRHRHDREARKRRRGIEAFLVRLKPRRRIATRYDKLAADVMGFVTLASTMLKLEQDMLSRPSGRHRRPRDHVSPPFKGEEMDPERLRRFRQMLHATRLAKAGT